MAAGTSNRRAKDAATCNPRTAPLSDSEAETVFVSQDSALQKRKRGSFDADPFPRTNRPKAAGRVRDWKGKYPGQEQSEINQYPVASVAGHLETDGMPSNKHPCDTAAILGGKSHPQGSAATSSRLS